MQHPNRTLSPSPSGTVGSSRHIPALSAVAVAAAAAALMMPAGPALAATPGVEGAPCPDGEGVTVVVDASDLDGPVTIGCADDAPATGTEALQQAGFTDARDAATMICAIDSRPDPCPTEWEGSYWSYWSAVDGTWQAYEVGSDTSEPAPDGIEGWRYNDGSEGPALNPDEVLALTPDPATTDGSADETTDELTATATSDDPAWGPGPAFVLAAGVLVLVAIGVVAVRRRRRLDPGYIPGEH